MPGDVYSPRHPLASACAAAPRRRSGGADAGDSAPRTPRLCGTEVACAAGFFAQKRPWNDDYRRELPARPQLERGRERGVQGGAKLPPLTEEAFRKAKGICKNTDSLFTQRSADYAAGSNSARPGAVHLVAFGIVLPAVNRSGTAEKIDIAVCDEAEILMNQYVLVRARFVVRGEHRIGELFRQNVVLHRVHAQQRRVGLKNRVFQRGLGVAAVGERTLKFQRQSSVSRQQFTVTAVRVVDVLHHIELGRVGIDQHRPRDGRLAALGRSRLRGRVGGGCLIGRGRAFRRREEAVGAASSEGSGRGCGNRGASRQGQQTKTQQKNKKIFHKIKSPNSGKSASGVRGQSVAGIDDG